MRSDELSIATYTRLHSFDSCDRINKVRDLSIPSLPTHHYSSFITHHSSFT